MKKSLLIYMISLISILSLPVNAQAQTGFWESTNAYLGQVPPGDKPKIFPTGMFLDSGIVLGRVAFSKDGKAFYYGFAKHWFDFNGTGIKKIVFDGKSWTAPRVLFKNLSNPTLSVDGMKLYLGGQDNDVWQSQWTANGWSPASLLLNKEYGLYNFQPTKSSVFYMGSNAGQGGKHDYRYYDFCTLTITKKDTIIKSLGIPLNTPAFDGDLYVAPDESYMIVSAKETKTYECELYISFRKADKTWTNPKSLGAAINDGLAHRFGQFVSPDGKYLFYTKGTGEKDCYIYWVRFDNLLKKLKNTNYEPYLKNPIPNYKARSNQAFSFKIPGNTFIDDDSNKSLVYSATLENGSKLPGWIKFNPLTRVLSGKAIEKNEYNIKITATDPEGADVSCTFLLSVE